jgi:hypothetical protein
MGRRDAPLNTLVGSRVANVDCAAVLGAGEIRTVPGRGTSTVDRNRAPPVRQHRRCTYMSTHLSSGQRGREDTQRKRGAALLLMRFEKSTD